MATATSARPFGPLFQHWNHRLRHWYGMFAGTSYYHQPQAIGRAFRPRELAGYFNDLTAKAVWKGKLDPQGLPCNTLTNGRVVRFPVVLSQKALGHWDLWLLHAREAEREHFLKISRVLRDEQDPSGGWDTWGPLGQPPRYRYSAMTQGEAVSVLLRAHKLAPQEGFDQACVRAIVLMRRAVCDEGVSWYEANDVFLEEYPAAKRDTVLNGWIFALFGLHDYLLLFPDPQVKKFYDRTSATLARHLSQFDAGFWSYYSSGTQRLASPFYHQLHRSQLEALMQILEHPELEATLERWTRYANRKLCRFRALVMKGYQKLREPCEITLVD